MAQHSNYWSCSRLADFIRGTTKPGSASWKEWKRWKIEARAAHPWRFWIAEKGLGKLQDFVTYPVRAVYDVKYYINNRFVTKSHALTAHPRDIKPGNWHDVGNRFLPCLFNELINFVEVEQASHHIAWADKEERKKYDAPFYARGWFKWRTWRSPAAGLDHLMWAASLEEDGVPTKQAKDAMEILALYSWWTKDRSSRPSPGAISGWDELCSRDRSLDDILGEDDSKILRAAKSQALNTYNDIETKYEQEDEDMMIRLIRVRRGLWT